MPIDETNRRIFIHIPKTGGTTIENVLNIGDSQPFWGYCNIQKYSKQHYTTYDIKKLYPQYSDYMYFTVVRNPYDRLVSVYNQKNQKTSDPWLVSFIGDSTYHEFLKNVKICVENKDYIGGSKIHFRPMCDFVDSSVQIFYYENLNSDLKRLDVDIPNQTHKNYASFYKNKEAIQLIQEIYSNDLKYFKYIFPYMDSK
jgi:hypothetical protein